MFRGAADIGVKKITKNCPIGHREWIGGGDGARFHGFAADVRPFLPDFNLVSAQETKGKKATSGGEGRINFCRYKDAVLRVHQGQRG